MAADKKSEAEMLIMIGAAVALNDARPHMVRLAQIYRLGVKGELKFDGEFEFLGRICKAAAEFVDTVLAEKRELRPKTATAEDAMELIRKAGS